MSEPCTCMTAINAKLRDRNTRLSTAFCISPSLNAMDCLPVIATQKIDTSKRVRATTVVATFCPFCGNKYPRADEAAASEAA